MRTIHKYAVDARGEFTLLLPLDARILSVQTQGAAGRPQMWVLVNPCAPPQVRKFRLFGTGHPVESNDDLEYVGTFQMEDGNLVFHLFEATLTTLPPVIS